jgi:hypothetical protein
MSELPATGALPQSRAKQQHQLSTNTVGGNHNSHHLAPPLVIMADDEHAPLRPFLYKLWIASQILELGPETRFTALVLLHRYYYYYITQPCEGGGIDSHDWKWIGAACLVLGMKAEEDVRRLRDVINVAQMLDFRLVGGHDIEGEVIDISTTPPKLNQDYWKAKEFIVATEQRVLRALSFDVLVSHPHRLVVLVVNDTFKKSPSSFQDDVITKAWQRLNQAIFHAPALMTNALTLACAAVELEVHRGAHNYVASGDASESIEACMEEILKSAATMRKKALPS